MKGLLLCEQFYKIYGVPMLHEHFPEYEDRIAAGLVGEGSECLGYDDEISTDHDFGPGFCLWLTDEDYSTAGQALQQAYDDLPRSYLGYERLPSPQAKCRTGVMCVTDFYRRFVGDIECFTDPLHWLRVPEHLITCAVSGKVFCDPSGRFTSIRSFLQEYYPEDIRIKKIAARLALMAQSGQYNYYRAMRRKEYVTARLSLDSFIRESISLVFLLNKTYMPYYKWAYRRLSELPVMSDTVPLIRSLAMLPIQDDTAIGSAVETICRAAIRELKTQGLTTLDHDFLDCHTAEVMGHIQNPAIRTLHVMQG